MMKTSRTRLSIASLSAVASSRWMARRCEQSIWGLTTPRLRDHRQWLINRPEFPEFRRQNFRNPQKIAESDTQLIAQVAHHPMGRHDAPLPLRLGRQLENAPSELKSCLAVEHRGHGGSLPLSNCKDRLYCLGGLEKNAVSSAPTLADSRDAKPSANRQCGG